MYNRKYATIIVSVLCVIAIGSLTPKNADSKIITNVPADVSGEEMKAIVIDDFEAATVGGDTGWDVQSEPKQFKSTETEQKMKMKNPVPTLEMKLINGFPNDMSVEEWSLTGLGKKKEKCIGIHFKFRYPGDNSIHILPPKELDWRSKKPVYSFNSSTLQNEQDRGLELPGKARGISLWVHGRGKPYNLEVWVKDYIGETHVLPFGSVNFVGWRPMKVYLPSYIPQATETYPQTRVSKITRFVLRVVPNSTAEEQTEETYFFMDQIKVLTDTFEVNFDGQNLDEAFGGGAINKGVDSSGTGAGK